MTATISNLNKVKTPVEAEGFRGYYTCKFTGQHVPKGLAYKTTCKHIEVELCNTAELH